MDKKLKNVLAFILDAILINISIMVAYYLRFGRNLTFSYFLVYLYMSPFVTIGKIMVLYYFGMYKNIWKYAGVDEIVDLFMAAAVSNGLVIIAIYMGRLMVPRSIYAIAFFIDLFLLGLSRFGTKIFKRVNIYDIVYFFKKDKRKRVMIVGAGEAGSILLQEYKNNKDLNMKPVCFIDDDPKKIGNRIRGIPVVGSSKDIAGYAISNDIDEIVIAIPSANNQDIKRIIEECNKTRCTIKIVPDIRDIREFQGDIKELLIKKIRNIDVNDLLGRDKVKLDQNIVSKYLNGKRVLITGGGGSIGSELARHIARFNPSSLILVDISENGLFDIQNEICYDYPNLDVSYIIGSVRDRERMGSIFVEYKPEIVFHAAAHKHVTFMEDAPGEAVKNNVLGTLNIVKLCDECDVKKFVLISTDKAVNPANIMGASKRICEMMVQAYNSISSTEYVAVRFGNVLGSNGSVIPLFKKQIERGGPVTVTHPEVIRYFMTVSEAVQLVLESAAMAKGGEIFVLDMGEPVSIDKLARDLIKLSGFEPDKDIEIKYIGLRPGEKLFEELLINKSKMRKTCNEKIYVEKSMEYDINELMKYIKKMEQVADVDNEKVISLIKELVPISNGQAEKQKAGVV
ncbi:polysaccharide biosynthesis protein [Lutispora thermophila]|uniref:NDP-sugar epimerase, includes UDP-GlcNAc-inverting 4,6-dehydratase FlaA1 and capsular polysaccharide biosynthesis protein EpsC n=1 Tax=Lutispora thermophila DSM 19022 TaxID=1122184 RepID=A0A1M6BY25_9FIRM|nr:nucleoside-diphosphate sugar epimerase/dehydratase [Lutispora thermophila]SHI53610.1 NDP-sugar epimerase, includes UDP-GlcNAc-inverting 4,6-dehydratase FlaA1 and capsular polysaccharide biosynthesis protein EpsC [Lutispora thermophila DSM 19022]